MHHINNNWDEEKRTNLEQDFIHYASDELMKAIQHTAQLAENQHYYPTYHEENVTQFNPETEGDFGVWGTD